MPNEEAFGSMIQYLGQKPLDLINLFTSEIPKHIKGIDTQAAPFLDELISLLDSLAKKWKEKGKPDEDLLSKTIEKLKSLTENPSPEKILYPQIMGATPTSNSEKLQDKEQEEIDYKKNTARKQSQTLIEEKVTPLLHALYDFNAPTITHLATTQGTLEKITTLKEALDELAREQRSPIGKVIHMIKGIIEQHWDNIVHGSKPNESLKANQHPLMKLLDTLGKCQQDKFYLKSKKKEDIIEALQNLDTLSPYFRGIYPFITSRIKEPHKDLTKLHNLITTFIQVRVQLKTDDIVKQTPSILSAVSDTAFKKGVQGIPETDSEKLVWVKKFLKGDLSQHTDWMDQLNLASIHLIASELLEANIYQIYDEAKRLSYKDLPQSSDHSAVMEWGYPLLNQAENLKQDYPSLSTLIAQAKEENRQRLIYPQIQKIIAGRKEELIKSEQVKLLDQIEQLEKQTIQELEKKIAGITSQWFGDKDALKREAKKTQKNKFYEEKEKLETASKNSIRNIESNQFWKTINEQNWGENFVRGKCTVPEDIFGSTLIGDEILWMALAYQQQMEECSKLEVEFQRDEEKTALGIMEALDNIALYLEKLPITLESLEEKKRKEKEDEINQHILSWLDFVRVQMLESTPDTFKKQEIEKAFEYALRDMRKGDPVIAIKYIQNFIQESPYGAQIWKGESSPLAKLSETFNAFLKTRIPPKPPKSKSEIYESLRIAPNEVWEEGFLANANAKEQADVVENALMFASFEFVGYCLGFDNTKEKYRRFVQILDGIKELAQFKNAHDACLEGIKDKKDQAATDIRNAHGNYDRLKTIYDESDSQDIKDALDPVVGPKGTKKPSVPNVEQALANLLGRENPLDRNNAEDKYLLEMIESDKGVHKELYFGLMNILLHEHTPASKRGTLWKTVAQGFFPLLYDLMELFVRPYAELIFNGMDELFDETNGNLSQKHLVPIKGATKALATYIGALEGWEKAYKEQPSSLKRRLDGTKDDIAILLSSPNTYQGKNSAQITREVGYAVANHVRLPDYCKKVQEWINKTEIWSKKQVFNNKYANLPVVFSKRLLATIPYAALYSTKLSVYLLTSTLNSFAQQGIKLYLWKTDIINKSLNKVIDSLFIDNDLKAPKVPVIDILLLEQLEDLLKELEKGIPKENATTSSKDYPNTKAISEVLEQFFKIIELDKHESLTSYENRNKMGAISRGKNQAYEQLKKLLSVVLVNTSKSLLKKEKMYELRFDLLKAANLGLRGQVDILTPRQKVRLAQKLNKDVKDLTKKEIEAEGERANEQIQKLLGEIRQKAVNPAIDQKIDEAFQTRSQLLLDYIHWIDKRFLSYNEKENKGNIIHFLKEKLTSFETSKDKDQIIRDIHKGYSELISQMTEFQSQIDLKPSPNSPELSRLIDKELREPLQKITTSLTKLIEDRTNENLKSCIDLIEELDISKIHLQLVRIEKAEVNRVMGMQSGIEGVVRKKLAEGIFQVKEITKGIAHQVVEWQTEDKLEKAQGLYKNPTLIKHGILWQMRLYLDPSLAFPLKG